MGSGQYGSYIGHLDVTFDESGFITSWKGDSVELNSATPSDPVIQV